MGENTKNPLSFIFCFHLWNHFSKSATMILHVTGFQMVFTTGSLKGSSSSNIKLN